jgi:hypothetical protein
METRRSSLKEIGVRSEESEVVDAFVNPSDADERREHTEAVVLITKGI